MPDDSKDLERTLTHFKDGHKNAQDTIRFVDTKAGVLIGLLMLTTAVPFGVLKWSAGLDARYPANLQNFQSHHEPIYFILFWGSIIGVLLGVCGIAFAAEGVTPRPPKKHYHGLKGVIKRMYDKLRNLHKKKNDKPPITVLFPYHEECDEDAAKKYFHDAAKGLSINDVIREYEAQAAQIGRILCIKMQCNRRAATCFRLQLWIFLVTAILAFIGITFFPL